MRESFHAEPGCPQHGENGDCRKSTDDPNKSQVILSGSRKHQQRNQRFTGSQNKQNEQAPDGVLVLFGMSLVMRLDGFEMVMVMDDFFTVDQMGMRSVFVQLRQSPCGVDQTKPDHETGCQSASPGFRC